MGDTTLSDSLFESLQLFAKLYHKPVSKQVLLEALPIDKAGSAVNLLTKVAGETLFEKIAYKAGFKAKLVKKKTQAINNLLLPAILILKDGTSCICESIDHSTSCAKIILPDFPDAQDDVSLKTLDELYIGTMFLLKKQYQFKGVHSELMKRNEKHWLWGTLRHNRSIYKDVVLTSILINFFVLASPLFVMNVYDRVVPNFALESLWALSIGVVIVFVLDAVIKYFRTYFLEIATKKADIIISSTIFDRVLNTKLSHRPKSVGSFAHTVRDFDMIKNFLSSSTVSVLVDLPFAVIFLSVVYFLGGNVVLISLGIIVFILVYALIIKAPLHESIERSNESISQKNGILIESLNALETIKSLGVSGHARWKWEEATGDIANKSIRTKILSTSVTTVTAFLIQLNTVLVVVFGVFLIHDNLLSLGGLIASVILSSRAIAPAGQFASLITSYEQAKQSYNQINALFQLPEERPAHKDLIHKESIDGDVHIKDLCFSYGEDERKALDGISLSIKAGEKVAIIGKVGSGKSTLLKLMMKLYEAQEGELLIDGVDVKQIEPADIRSNIAYVSQESVLFNGTLKENILYKTPYASDKTLLKALHVSQLMEFVNHHPKGLDLLVGERGDTLSGGQKKAISIARAIVGEFALLLLDEPTDSMDTQTEAKLKHELREISQDRTMLIVTHKSSMLDLVDRIIVMDQGKIVLDGDKATVLAKLSKGGRA